MAYPPLPYRIKDPAPGIALMRAHPFAQLLTGHGALRATRVPVLADVREGLVWQLRAHLDALNPQAKDLDGAAALVVFSGPSAYVSPNWRADKTKGGTYDYQEVQVRGVARVVGGAEAAQLDFFLRLIDDLSALIEPQHPDISEHPVWQTPMAPPGHIARQVHMVTSFTVEVEAVETVFKLHQNFPEADRQAVAAHLARSPREQARQIAAAIAQDLAPEAQVIPSASPAA